MTTFIVQSPSFLEEDNIPPISRVAANQGERNPSPIQTNFLRVFEIIFNSTLNMATNTNQNQPNVLRNKSYLSSVLGPLKLNDNL